MSDFKELLYKCIEKVLIKEAAVDLPSLLLAAKQLGFSETINTQEGVN